MLTAESGEVDFDAHLEQQQDDADVGEELELRPVGDVAGREWRDRQPHREVPDDGGQPKPPGDPAGRRGHQEDDAQLEDRRRGRVHRRAPA